MAVDNGDPVSTRKLLAAQPDPVKRNEMQTARMKHCKEDNIPTHSNNLRHFPGKDSIPLSIASTIG